MMSIKLDKKDVAAIANDRVFRDIRTKLLVSIIVLLAVMGLGIWVTGFSQIGGAVLFYLPILVLIYGIFWVGKLQKRERSKLLNEWQSGERGKG